MPTLADLTTAALQQASGLTPVWKYSLQDHAMAVLGNIDASGLTSIARTYLAANYAPIGGGGGGAPTGNAGGDLGSTYPNPSVIGINGVVLSGLATGILKITHTTGVPSVAVSADIPLAAIGATGPMPAATTLDAITAPAGNVAMNAHKITGLANGTATTDAAAFGQLSLVPVNTQTANYTSVLGDAGECVEMNLAGANTFTVPLNATVAYPIGTIIEVCQYGAGQTTITATGGVTIHTAQSLTTRAQYSTVCLRKRATDEWILSGDLT